ncbi:MAG: hypothetical protein MZV64_59895 [Ignavibacteriales bacterium]|nr:hypothetical protein [Ignavibacteriales bacterium]
MSSQVLSPRRLTAPRDRPPLPPAPRDCAPARDADAGGQARAPDSLPPPIQRCPRT